MDIAAAPRMRRVSRNFYKKVSVGTVIAAPRMRRVSRNPYEEYLKVLESSPRLA